MAYYQPVLIHILPCICSQVTSVFLHVHQRVSSTLHFPMHLKDVEMALDVGVYTVDLHSIQLP